MSFLRKTLATLLVFGVVFSVIIAPLSGSPDDPEGHRPDYIVTETS
ncbi:hypothetical protein HYG86_03520 [Alkalicella caledoniensis]|uniref:Uncharacterized protein n=1 Tax=Alkalicella caledoniensis TaxID=2731377 RepID=A0A7G9W5E0_ALKCA|nr:hypothetical protein [Alkalicella caledoniensis]QNO13902.1 hypothetical protein HYG86_03520 [Alkalicella caledoniensis]